MATKVKPQTNGTVTETEPEPPKIPKQVHLKRIERATIDVAIEGVSPLITHQFNEKMRQQMLAKQQTKTRTPKDFKDPEADYQRSMYRFDDGGHGFPAVGFKAAIVDGARMFEGVTMTELRTTVHVLGEGAQQLVRINAEPRMREDTVRVPAGGNADLRYRAEYTPWTAVLTITYIPSMISAESMISLVDASGLGGVGEWRPSKAKTGVYGMYRVAE